MWTIYSTLNYTSQMQHGKIFNNMILLKIIIKNLTKDYIVKKANVLSAVELFKLFETDLLYQEDSVILEMIVGFLLILLRLLCASEVLVLTCKDVLHDHYTTNDNETW